MRRYPQFHSTPSKAQMFPSVGGVVEAQTVVRRKYTQFHSNQWKAQTLSVTGSSGASTYTLGTPTYVTGSITSTGFRPRIPVTVA